jgi:nitroreductase
MELGKDAEQTRKATDQFTCPPMVVAVIASPKPSEKIPVIEQHLSAGAVCLALLNAALAAGWGANWLTAWMAYDPVFLSRTLHLEGEEFVAGYIAIGTETSEPPDRPRPDLDQITSWLDK